MESTLDVKYILTLALRSQIFEYWRETFYIHALEYLQSARRSEKKGNFFFFAAETPDHY